MVYGGAKRRKGEVGGGGNSLLQVGFGGSPPKKFEKIASKLCILSACYGNQYTLLTLKIYEGHSETNAMPTIS